MLKKLGKISILLRHIEMFGYDKRCLLLPIALFLYHLQMFLHFCDIIQRKTWV